MTTPETLDLLKTLEEQILDPAIRRSPQALAALLSDDFLEFTPSGRVYHRESVISALAAESGATSVEMTNHGYELRPLAEDVVLLTYNHVARREDGAESRSLRSSIWKRVDGRWRLAFHQGTPAD